MKKILDFVERNSLEIKLSFYLMFLVFGWSFLIGLLFSHSENLQTVNLYFFYFACCCSIVYLLIKKRNSSKFLLFIPVRFVFFYFFFQIIFFFGSGNNAVLNRQKYDDIDEFIITQYEVESIGCPISLVTNFLKKLFK